MGFAIASAVCVFLSCLVGVSSQDQNVNTTDPSEARALNSIFNKWDISASWNTSGELCSGQAINSTTPIDAFDINTFIKCDCFNGTCHINALKVYDWEVEGEIPEELWTLTHLTYLNLSGNYFLTGSLPPAIGNLTRMQILDLGGNNFVGSIPSELGKLVKLKQLDLGGNSFTGSIPFELGKLVKLEQLNLDGLGLSGQIPPTFANLKNLKKVSASYMGLMGRIPNFIGSWSNLTELSLQRNSFEGPIPSSFGNLTSLNSLNLGQNYLTGSLPPAIGNLKHMQYMRLGINSLSGELPKELGNLTDLIVLDLGSNNFSGSIPSELGKLMKLEQLYLNSSGLSGQIPPSFANLKNLETVWASDMELTGRIPDFVGSWSNLTDLMFQGNSFEGPIPASFGNLTSLTDLRISEISNGSSSLAFIRNMKSLTVLVLRNNNISDSIPSNISEFQDLTYLDLSFNNIIGRIPGSLFNLSSLKYLFLGNNKLSGTIPTRKSPYLAYIDLSYNNLSGSLPSWVNQTDLQLNLVANNLIIEGSTSSALPFGLDCLQQNFPCFHDAGKYDNFAIKCGGDSVTSAEGITYDRDVDLLGPATYFVSDTRRWAVSNVGLFTELDNDHAYIISVSNQSTDTVDSQLFKTARLSASSLRYYGLGLENGYYNISLFFAETSIQNSTTWESLGRRVFDIYIQGNRVLKDFNIKREAGSASFRAIRKDFRVLVLENLIEIHLFWAGKGTCCIPTYGTYGPLISAISATRDFIPTVSAKNRTSLIVGIVVGVGFLSFMSVVVVFYIIHRRKRDGDGEEELVVIDTKLYTFSFSELKNATDDFNSSNKLGEGGFGPVYKGTLNDRRKIAVKQLSVGSYQGKSQFIAEIATISTVQHRNLVKLYGCCLERNTRLIVYEYMENKSLDQALFGNCLSLSWSTRYDICTGIARGLAYLHEESCLRIVHRDVKASNILLDHELTPKISDFGLAKLYDDKKTHISTRVAGTIGYLAPEYAMRGHLTEKADVFSFGVLALEIVSGRPNSDSGQEGEMYLLGWAWQLHENNSILGLVDPRLSTDFNEEEIKRIVGISLLCTQSSPLLRPAMSRVVAMLSGDIEVSTVTSKPGYLIDWRFDDVSSFMTSWATKQSGSGTSSYYSPPSTSTFSGANQSPIGASKPILHHILGEDM